MFTKTGWVLGQLFVWLVLMGFASLYVLRWGLRRFASRLESTSCIRLIAVTHREIKWWALQEKAISKGTA